MDVAENLQLQVSHELVGLQISLMLEGSMPPPPTLPLEYMETSSEASTLRTMLVALLMLYTNLPL